MKTLLFILLSSFFILETTASQQVSSEKLDKIFTANYRHYIISKGDNRPDFDRKKDSLDLFLISLHSLAGYQPS